MAEYTGPGSTIGIFGGGQLGRMTALEARRMGYRVIILDPAPSSPAAQVADETIAAPYDDADAARELARRCDVLTYEFENIPVQSVEAAEAIRLVRPSSRVLRVAQNRLREKATMSGIGVPVPVFHPVGSVADLEEGLEKTGVPAILKTATLGYDGKGQALIESRKTAHEAFERLAAGLRRADTRGDGGTDADDKPFILEERIEFVAEVSVICARTADGQTACYPPIENIHKNGILDLSLAPGRISLKMMRRAEEIAIQIAEALDVVGLLTVEMFLDSYEELYVNEIAPRPHNSGHLTLEACVTSQFEQLIRAICGLPLGSTFLMKPTAMANLLGDVWLKTDGRPSFAAALANPGVSLHLYGKSEAREGRKMGHITAVAETDAVALALAQRARSQLLGQ